MIEIKIFGVFFVDSLIAFLAIIISFVLWFVVWLIVGHGQKANHVRKTLDSYFLKYNFYIKIKEFCIFCRKYKEYKSDINTLECSKQAEFERIEAQYTAKTDSLIQECNRKHDRKVSELSQMFENMTAEKEKDYTDKCDYWERFYQGKRDRLEHEYQDKKNSYLDEKEKLDEKRRVAEAGYQVAMEQSNKCSKMVEGLIEETTQSHPWLANQLADIQDSYYAEVELWLRTKAHPAEKRADILKDLRAAKREVDARCKQLEYQVNFWLSVLPWLEDFQEVPDKEAWKYKDGVNSDAEEYEVVREFLSPDEYNKLPQSKKYQMYIDRYLTRPSSSAWKAGIKFERYVGYLLESQGWRVEYHGALYGLDDMGIDLVASKGEKNLAIQCKWWSEFKTIHENYICQLVGSVAMISVKEKKKYTPVFVCTCSLSDTAREVAEYLDVKLVEIPDAKESIKNYPCIKCNASGAERIYHLPFDQMYDRTQIAGKKNSFFAHTITEAENAGFRHAYRHNFGG